MSAVPPQQAMLFVLEKNAQGRSYVRLFARWALRSSNPRFLAKALHTSVLRCHTTLGLLQRPPRCRQLLPVASETNRGYHQPSQGTGKNGFFATPQRHRSVNHTIQFSRGSRSSEDFFFFSGHAHSLLHLREAWSGWCDVVGCTDLGHPRA